MNHRPAAVLLAAATTALLSIAPSAHALVPGESSPRPCRNSSKAATMTVEHDNKANSLRTTGFTFDNPCSHWVMAIFLGAAQDAVFRFYAAPGAHVSWNAKQAQQAHIKDGFNGNPIMLKAPHCAKQGRKELIVEANGRVHTTKPCKK